MRFTITFDNNEAQITPMLPERVVAALFDKLSYEKLGVAYADYYDDRVRFFSRPYQMFPTGLLGRVKSILTHRDIECVMVDKRVKPVSGPPLKFLLTLWPFQRTAATAALRIGRGVVSSPTGSGKTVIFAYMISKLNLPTIIYTYRLVVAEQTRDCLQEYLGIKIGLVSGEVFDPAKITVCTVGKVARALDPTFGMKKEDKEKWKEAKEFEKITFKNNAQRLRLVKMIEQSKVAIWDECQHLPALASQLTSRHSTNSYYRYGFSATPYRTDNATMTIRAITGKKIVKISYSELENLGYLVPIRIMTFSIPRSDALTRRLTYSYIYANMVVENEYRNDLICKIASMNYSHKLSTLIAVTHIRHGEILLEKMREKSPGIVTEFLTGAANANKKKEILKDLQDKRIDVLIATTAYGEGVNVRSLDSLINAKAAESTVDTMQLLGRISRIYPGKRFGYVYDFCDNTKYLLKHYHERLKVYESEKSFDVYKKIKLSQIEKVLAS